MAQAKKSPMKGAAQLIAAVAAAGGNPGDGGADGHSPGRSDGGAGGAVGAAGQIPLLPILVHRSGGRPQPDQRGLHRSAAVSGAGGPPLHLPSASSRHQPFVGSARCTNTFHSATALRNSTPVSGSRRSRKAPQAPMQSLCDRGRAQCQRGVADPLTVTGAWRTLRAAPGGVPVASDR